jgi:hypothetical protein
MVSIFNSRSLNFQNIYDIKMIENSTSIYLTIKNKLGVY